MLFRIPQGETITRQALGRIHQLGDLYNAYTDNFCGNGIFNGNLPENAISLTDNGNTYSRYIYMDTMREKLDELRIEGELMV